ncbi:MAG: amidohydrolase family protein [Pseudomonadota bacterium]
MPVAPPPPAPEAPATPLPEGAIDAHVHIVAGDFPLWERRVEDPPPGDLTAWLARLEAHLAALGAGRVVLVHSILHGTANDVTLAALARLGDRARGVGLLPDGADEAALDRLAGAGVRAVRLNYVHGGVLSWDGAKALAPALAARGMHIEMLLHAHLHLEALAGEIAALPCPLVIDHIGWPDLAGGAEAPGVRTLCRLLAEGRVWVKLSAPYRMCTAPYDEAAPVVAALAAANSERLLWGSDWPHLMLGGAAMPRAAALADAVQDVVTGAEARRRLFVSNPAALYAF